MGKWKIYQSYSKLLPVGGKTNTHHLPRVRPLAILTHSSHLTTPTRSTRIIKVLLARLVVSSPKAAKLEKMLVANTSAHRAYINLARIIRELTGASKVK